MTLSESLSIETVKTTVLILIMSSTTLNPASQAHWIEEKKELFALFVSMLHDLSVSQLPHGRCESRSVSIKVKIYNCNIFLKPLYILKYIYTNTIIHVCNGRKVHVTSQSKVNCLLCFDRVSLTTGGGAKT